MSNDVKLEMKGLKSLIRIMSADSPTIKVGVLGSGNGRNATVGAVFEFGSSKQVGRSFLRMPLSTYLSKYLDSSKELKESIRDAIQTKSLLSMFKKIAVLAEKVVLDAFNTGGFGQWAPWKNPNYMNRTGMLGVDTQQLRDSITSEVK